MTFTEQQLLEIIEAKKNRRLECLRIAAGLIPLQWMGDVEVEKVIEVAETLNKYVTDALLPD